MTPDDDLMRTASTLEYAGYTFRATSREYSVIYKSRRDKSTFAKGPPETVLTTVTLYDDEGGLSSHSHVLQGRENMRRAIEAASKHLTRRITDLRFPA